MQDADAACGGLSHHFGIELTSQRGSTEVSHELELPHVSSHLMGCC